MRKLSLKNLKLEASEMLGRNQLKTVLGGYSAGSWWCVCNSGTNIGSVPSCSSSNCNWACTNQRGWSGSCGCAGWGC